MPNYRLARDILSDSNDKTRILLLRGVNGTPDIAMRKELEQLEAQFPDRLQVTYAVSQVTYAVSVDPECTSVQDKIDRFLKKLQKK
jgi:NAD(P)H-flavin reductase